MAGYILPLVALAGMVNAAPQAVNAGAGGGANAGVGVNGNGAAPVTSLPKLSTTLATVPIATTIAAPAVPGVGGVAVPSAKVPAVPGLGGLPSVAVPAVGTSLPGVPAAPGLPSVAVPAVGTALPAVPAAPGVPSVALPAVGTALPAVPAVPGVPSVAVPAVGTALPAIPAIPSLTGVPAILVPTLPTGSIPITFPTTVPITASSIIASLGTLPVNADATGVISSALGSLTTSIPSLPTAGLPALPVGSLALTDLLDTLGDVVFAKVASEIAELFASVTSAAGSAVATPDPASILSALQAATAVGALPTGVPAIPAVPALPTGGLPNITGRKVQADESVEKRQLGALSGLTGGVTGGKSPVSGLTGGLGGVTGAASTVTSLLGSSANPLTAVTGLLGGTSALGGISSSLPIGTLTQSVTGSGAQSVVLGVVSTLPIPAQLSTIVTSLTSVASLDLPSILSGTDILNQITALTSMGTTLAALNPATLGPLALLTSLPAIQSFAMLIDTPDLATIMYTLTAVTSVVPGGLPVRNTERIASAAQAGIPLPLDSLLANPSSYFAVLEKVQPLVSCLPCVASFAILEQIGALGVQNTVPGIDTSAVDGILSKFNLPLPLV